MIRKISLILLSAAALMVILYMAGPSPSTPSYDLTMPHIPIHDLYSLQKYVGDREYNDQPIKPGNQARIVWVNDTIHNKTKYALVYLHGFSASQEEGNPVHRYIAKKYGMNMFLSRLAEHGKSVQEPLLKFTAEKAWHDAKEALAIGKELGEKVILMSTSTGGTLSLKLCAEYPEINAQILLSPNVKVKDPKAWMLNNHWGLSIARNVLGSDYRTTSDTSAAYVKNWNNKYRIEALTQLEELLETTMTPATFAKVNQPTLMLYYYKDDTHQDQVVRVDAMLNMFDQITTPALLKYKKAMPETGDHAIGSNIKSHDVTGVEEEISKFLEGQLGILPVSQ